MSEQITSTGCMKCGSKSDICHYNGCPALGKILNYKPMTENYTQRRLEEFDDRLKEFVPTNTEQDIYLLAEDFKNFLSDSIAQAVAEERGKVVENIKKLRADCKSAKPADEIEEVDERAYCAALDDLLSLSPKSSEKTEIINNKE